MLVRPMLLLLLLTASQISCTTAHTAGMCCGVLLHPMQLLLLQPKTHPASANAHTPVCVAPAVRCTPQG
jgi:hypothetical protein